MNREKALVLITRRPLFHMNPNLEFTDLNSSHDHYFLLFSNSPNYDSDHHYQYLHSTAFHLPLLLVPLYR
jgi:hypothetical protein